MTERTQRQRVAIKKVGRRGSRVETLSNSLLEPPQRRGPVVKGFVEMPRIPPKQWLESNR